MDEVGSVIVFVRTKHGADRLARLLERRGQSIATIHGNRSQSQRERALSDLRRGRIQVLVATDIAARGIDVEGITHVINYDPPHSPEDYVHRIGRTGRVDAVGDAFTLMAPEEQKDVAAIEKFLGRAIPRVTLPDFDYKARGTPAPAGESRGPRGGSRSGGSGGSGRSGFSRSGGPSRPGGSSRPAASGRHGGASRPNGDAAKTYTSRRPGFEQAPSRPDTEQSSHGRRKRRESPAERARRRR